MDEREKGPQMASDGDEVLETKPMQSEKGIHNLHAGAPAEILNGHLVELEVDLARVIGEDDVEGDWDADTSPFPAVRAVVPESDDPEMPVNTFRAWFLGIVSVAMKSLVHVACREVLLKCSKLIMSNRYLSFLVPASTNSSLCVTPVCTL